MNKTIKSIITLGLSSILLAGAYVNTELYQTDNKPSEDIEQFVITERIKEEPAQIPVIREKEDNVKTVSAMEGVKLIPKPKPVEKPIVNEPAPIKQEPVIQKPAQLEKPVKETETIKPVEKKKEVKPVKKEVKKQAPTPKQPEKPKTDNIKAIDRARNTTKGYCAPELWVKWESSSNDKAIGSANRSINYWKDKSNPDIQTTRVMINPVLDGEIDAATHTAWHECAHAKTYNIDKNKIDEILKEINREFSGKNTSRMEELADAMATVKTGSSKNNYYQEDFTKSQLKLAEKIWNLSPEITPEMEYDFDAYEKIRQLN